MSKIEKIIVRKAREHNLKSIDATISKNETTVVTGVSGSGKSSLAFDTIFAEGQRRYLESFSSHARSLLGKTRKPEFDSISGLQAAISIDQKTTTANSRSTVGTLSEIYDHLRLLFARLGNSQNQDLKLDRSLFSFNSPRGACVACKGLGVQDRIDPELLISDPTKTIREGAFVMTTPSGYIVYSQVTMDVLNDVCNAHNFSVDIPWQELTNEQKKVIFYGSERIKVPFGKHTLESRLKWSGITAKPREEGYYTGIITIMEDILKRDRNKNILRFSKSITCPECQGTRLNKNALSVTFYNKTIADFNRLTLENLNLLLAEILSNKKGNEISKSIITEIKKRLEILLQFGLGYLTLDRKSTTLSGGEAQRIRMAIQTQTDLQNVLYVLDEPSIGLYPLHNKALINALSVLQQKGNTLLIVEHDEDFIRTSQNLIDIGPKAGIEGGELLFSGKTKDFFNQQHPQSFTWKLLNREFDISELSKIRKGNGKLIQIKGAKQYNLKNIDVNFKIACLNVVCGVSGSGKSTLVQNILVRALRRKLSKAKEIPGNFDAITGLENVGKIIDIDQSAIGRTQRSNPATYTKLFDEIRSLFAEQPEAVKRGWKKNRFSFNVKGGRCEHCQGSGIQEIGMHFLSNVAVPCQTCNGNRFNAETLEIKYKNKNIFEVLELTVDEAITFFEKNPKILHILSTLQFLGLGYVQLGQPSTTLSGGEAQRVKLASELAKPATQSTLYVLDEPTTGLHLYDVNKLLKALQKLVDNGNTVIIIEHHPQIVFSADHIVELGPDSGENGGEIIFNGTVKEILNSKRSVFSSASLEKTKPVISRENKSASFIELENVSTNNLKNISLKIPHDKITVITGVSGSGKSSLAFDTIFSEGHKRFTESLSTYARSFMKNLPQSHFDKISGLSPTIAISQRSSSQNPRSTVGTFTQIYDLLRLLFARISTTSNSDFPLLSNQFSFNHESGACPQCKGLGSIDEPDPEKIISNPEKSVLDGAMNGSKTGRFYGDPFGQYIAILKKAAAEMNLDLTKSWRNLSEKEKEIVMFGSGEKQFDVTWNFKRKNRSGQHNWRTEWKGFCNYIAEEYERKHQDKRGKAMLPLFSKVRCNHCDGSGLKQEILKYKIAESNIFEIASLSVLDLNDHLQKLLFNNNFSEIKIKILQEIIPEIQYKINKMNAVGLSYLSCSRRTDTLSGGEMQRLRLAAQAGGNLTGITYILDEPTIGLHPRDTEKLIKILRDLRDQGNTIIVVEHDREVISSSDHIIEIGPAAGNLGGKVTLNDSKNNLMKYSQNQTVQYLQNRQEIHQILLKKPDDFSLRVYGATANNLKKLDLQFPNNLITVITGVSGSGKTSLLMNVIYSSFQEKTAVNCSQIKGLENFEDVILIDQKPPAKSAISNPATYLEFFTAIRKLFAQQDSAKSAGLKAAHFSYLNKAGQCPNCKGLGYKKVSMDFLSDMQMECELCNGKRYNDEVLNIKYNGLNIFEVLNLEVEEAARFFNDQKKIVRSLGILIEIGLGYLQLGQALNTLSGGEIQRLKLSKSLVNAKSQNSVLYLLDEPTTGLHFADISKLMILLEKLRNSGNTIILIEHNTDVIKACDWIIDLGPEGGDEGGNLVAACTPDELKKVQESITGRFL